MKESDKIYILGELAYIENVLSIMQMKLKSDKASKVFLTEKASDLVNFTNRLEKTIKKIDN